MDLLFHRYASPLLLLDGIIQTSQFTHYVAELMRIINEEKTWEVWMHRAKDKTYSEFQRAINTSSKSEAIDRKELEATVKNSNAILNSFKPS